uniref:EF-hand domain-containing protein n=1 Tax=Phytophthora ramorum TaxID=164328 RepID=H3HBA9_PHYRM
MSQLLSNPPTSVMAEADASSRDPTSPDKRGSVWQWAVGCAFLVCVAIIWNFSSVLIQYIFNDLSFEAPFFLTSFSMALSSVNLPIYYVTKESDLPQVKIETSPAPAQTPHDKATLRRTMIAAAVVAPLWFVANFAYNESLNLTSVTSSTILSTTSTVFTLILAVWILKERFTDGTSESFWGNVCALIGAIMYGVYTTAIRKYLPDDAGMSVSLFIGFVGVFSLVALGILCIIFNYTGVESLRNLTWEIVGLLFVQGLLNNVLADYLWAVSIMYTSTTTATIGLSLTVPMAILSDWIVNDISPNYVTFISSVLVLGGFVVLAVSTRKEQLRTGAETEWESSSSAGALSPKSPATKYRMQDPVTETKMDVMMNMTTEDVRRLRGQFTASLDLEAFVRLMKKSLRDRIHSELDFVVGVIELFHTIDVNGDAVLDWDEFTAYMMDAGQAKADFYFEGRGQSDKHYVPLSMPPPDTKTPLRNIATRVHQMRLLADQNAMAYFEASSDVVYIYGLQFDRNDGPRHLSTMRLHTAFAEHIIIDVVYVPTRKSLVTSSILVRGYLSIWSVADLYNPVMTHRLESHAAQEHLCWASDSRRDSYRPNAGTGQPHTKISQLELWDLSGKIRVPPPGTIATKEVTVVQERLKGVTAIVAFRSINRSYLAVGREDGILSVVDTETGQEVGSFDAHGSGVKVLVYSTEVESIASVGFHSYADETSRQHEAPVELLAFVDSKHQLISVDRTETFNVYSSVMRTPTSEPWECLQTFRMFVVPETTASDPVLVTAGTKVNFYDHCEVKPREEVFFAYFCSALNVVVGATSTKLLLWKGDTGALWKTYEYATIVLSTKNPTAVNSHLGTKQADDPESREAQARAITAVCVDDRERKVIVGDDTGSIKVLNAVNGNVMKELDPHTNCVVGVSYVLYGKRVISISSDSVLHICDEDNPQGFYVPFGGGPILSS